jgi:hypothetical protein
VALRFTPAPGWPPMPDGFVPPPGWQPDPGWPPAPPGWQFWVDDGLPSGTGPNPYSTGANPYSTGANPYSGPYPTGTNGLAIASFVLGILGFLFITAVLSLIFGIIALGKIRQVPQRGKGLAIAGLVLSVLWLAGLTTSIVINATNQANQSPNGQITGRGNLSVFSLREGDCFDNPTSGSVTTVTAIPCDQAHNAQVFAQFDAMNASTYPGSSALQAEATHGCNADITGNVDKAKVPATMTIRFIFPLQGSWNLGHRTVSCLLVNPTSNLTSSLLTHS